MTCPHCGSGDLRRLPRRNLIDHLRALFNRWPYRCRDCARRFTGNVRWQEPITGRVRRKPADMVSRKASGEPTAQILVRAETHEQLDHILLALNNAVSAYGRAEPVRPSATETQHTQAP